MALSFSKKTCFFIKIAVREYRMVSALEAKDSLFARVPGHEGITSVSTPFASAADGDSRL